MGGEMQTKLWPRNEAERKAAVEAGYELGQVLNQDELVRSDDCFFAATGVTDGDLLEGVHYDRRGASTESLVMRSKSGTVRLIRAHHRLEKLQDFASVDFGFRSPAHPWHDRCLADQLTGTETMGQKGSNAESDKGYQDWVPNSCQAWKACTNSGG